jgi:senataxin
VRIGPNYHPSIQEHCLDYIINQKLLSSENETKEIDKLKQEILMSAKIICSTLSIAGSNTLLTLNQKFDTVIIDEAGQSVEVSSLIPLKYNCERLILVGDPKQLSATVFSRTAIKYNYDLSLFRRFQDAGQDVVILRTQYRMNPYLSKFISETFYDGKLLDSQSIKDSAVRIFDKIDKLRKDKDKERDKDMNSTSNRKKLTTSSNTKETLCIYDKCLENAAFQPFVFFDLESKENYDNNSCFNEHQANFVVELVNLLLKIYNNNVEELISKIAIISPYSTQVLKIKIGLRRVIEYQDICPIEVNTVDGFQGKEKEIIIFSTVRSKGSKTIGFLKDEKRVNVGLSRAKTSLIVVGDSKTLIQDTNWEKLVKYAYREAIFYKVAGNIKDYLANLESKLLKNDQLIRITKDEDFVRAVYSN